MAKFYGPIGYADGQKETAPGVWEDNIREHKYYGDLLRNIQTNQVSGGVNDNLNLSNQISIISDLYARQNIHLMRYVEFMGVKWKITNVDGSQYPRLVLTMGGVYNGK